MFIIVFVFVYRDILDLNEMHKDLNEHINDQGETVDRIGLCSQQNIFCFAFVTVIMINWCTLLYSNIQCVLYQINIPRLLLLM